MCNCVRDGRAAEGLKCRWANGAGRTARQSVRAERHGTAMNYGYNHTGSISSGTTQTSSVFSHENEDYDSRIREIEEYYIKTLLSENSEEEDQLWKQQQQLQQQQPQSFYTPLPSLYQSRASFSGSAQGQRLSYSQGMANVPQQAAQQTQNNAYGQQLLQHQTANPDPFQVPQQQWLQYQDPWPQKATPKEPSLEVEINSQYRPANGIMPLTSENLRMIQATEEQQPAAAPAVKKQQPAVADHVDNSRATAHSRDHGCHSAGCNHNHGGRRQSQTSSQAEARAQSNARQRSQEQQQEKINRSLYKTELCESWVTKGTCKYGSKCQFAHGIHELRLKVRSNNYKTKPCINWQKYGYCRYGKRCCFKHGDDDDIEIYKQAGILKMAEDTQPAKKNLHANVKVLQKMTW